MAFRSLLIATTALGLTSLAATPILAQDTTSYDESDDVIILDPISVQSFEEEVLQALGVSTISSEELAERPVANDISEIVRKMPGVNLTGASATGQRGNQRQIDIRGMGPENTLILIDGKPVLSRNAVKMGRGGERDTRGDSNWVPAELIERIEVIRGPAAARYGSGAAGGVVNIVTKKPEDDFLQLSTHFDIPENDAEGAGQRYNFLWAKTLSDRLSFRLTGNYNRTDADEPEINKETTEGEVCTDRGGNVVECSYPAGVEGVENKDATALLRYEMDGANTFDLELGYSRQGNIFAGDSQLSNNVPGDEGSTIGQLASEGAETNVMERYSTAITHRGDYAFGESMSYLQFEHTENRRLSEGASGGGEGAINSTDEYFTVEMNNLAAKTEWVLPGNVAGREAAFTYGAELRYEHMDNEELITARGDIDFDFGETVGDADARDPENSQTLIGLYAEANIEWTEDVTLSPSVRVDWADTFGTNISGGLNASWDLSPSWTVKGGAALAFKAPNLYQLNPNYIYVTRGRGCPADFYLNGPCYVLGNEDLEPETSFNIELGAAYSGPSGLEATLTAFRNKYRDKIQSGNDQVAAIIDGCSAPGGGTTDCRVFQWANVPEAVVSGVEGSLQAPLSPDLALAANLTYMIESKNEETGMPLSLVPEYTVNASVEWTATDSLTLIPSLTHYGRIDSLSESPITGQPTTDDDRDPYTLFNLAGRYEFYNGIDVTFGVNNVFDKTILRSGDGANTFNEPGRAYYVGVSKTF